MLKIGDFSRISQVTVKALRFYDEIGLLRAAHVDDFTGYRYYTVDQLPRLNRILALKELGFTLEQIADALSEGVTAEQLRGMLRLKQAEIQQRMETAQELLTRVEARLQQIEQEGTMSNYEVILKKVEPLKVASIRAILPNYQAVGQLFGEVFGYLQQKGVRPAGACLALWHDNGYKESDVDGEGCCPIAEAVAGNDRVKVYDLPGGEMACVVHHGTFSTLTQAYGPLLEWIAANGYTVTGAGREVYLQVPATPGDQNDASCVTEVQFPVAKA
jgi:effector-binding domain-containing protein